MNKVIQAIKEVSPNSVCVFKIGVFGHCYDKDACVMSYIFGYKIKSIDNNKECGFPLQSLNKVCAKLEPVP